MACLLAMPVAAWGDSVPQAGVPLHEIGNFEIHGYIRGWEFTASVGKIDYRRLTSVNLAESNAVNSSGLLNATSPSATAIAMRDAAHAAGAKANIVVMGSSSAFNSIGTDWTSQYDFAVSVRNYLRDSGLDGANLDWEFPQNDTEAGKLVGIVNQMNAIFASRTVNASILGQGPWYNNLMNAGYAEIDRAHVMAYGGTGNGTMSQATSRVNYVLDQGARKNQVLLGLPFFGHNGSQGIGFGAIRNWDNYNPNTDVVDGYHLANNDTMRQRMRYAIDNGLAGVTIWSIGIDSFTEDHPHGELMDVVYSEVARQNQAPWRPGTGANVIGINFVGGSPTAMGQTEVAGMASQNHWNNAAGAAGTVTALQNGYGHNSGARVTYEAGLGVGKLNLQNTAGERRMMGGYLDTTYSEATTVSVSDIPYDKYYVLVYADAANGDSQWRGKYTLTADGFQRSVTLTDQANATFTGRMTIGGNYTVFGSVDGADAFRLRSTGYGLRAPINGLQIVDLSHRISLADIVGGGNGFGTGSARGLSAVAAVKGVTTNPNVSGSGVFPAYLGIPSNPFVDGIFAPRDDLSGYYYQKLDSAGHQYRFGLDGGAGGPTKAIFNGSQGVGNPTHANNASMDFDEVMGFGTQHGITFDLDAIRNANQAIAVTGFTAIVGENRNVAGGTIAYFVFIDGVLAQWDIKLTDTEQFIYLTLDDADRFLTLAITNSGDGSTNDLGYFANPYILFSNVSVPEPGTLTVLALGLATARRRKHRYGAGADRGRGGWG